MPLTDVFSAARWWAVILIIGLAAFPLTYRVLRRLPDRGYAFTKMSGLLFVSYFFWILNTLGFLNNSVGGAFFSLLILGGLSFAASRFAANTFKKDASSLDSENDPGWISWVKANWRYMLFVELLFVVIFGLWVWVRSQNPAITGTEKPMEFAFLNSVGRSNPFPPLDPWLSGFAISYYYFGYIMTSLLVRMAAVPEAIGFNLAIAWLIAGTAIGAFGILYNLISSDTQSARTRAIVFGVIAAIAISLAGNMEIFLEVLHENGIGSQQFWTWLDVRDLDNPPTPDQEPRYQSSQWWWWRSSRVIHEYHLSGRVEEGLEPIAEFPAFSFVLGDLHPHVLALPFAFLSLAVALNWWRLPAPPLLQAGKLFSRQGIKKLLAASSSEKGRLFWFTALLLGGLSFLNTWDVLIHLFIIVGAYTLALWRLNKKWSGNILSYSILMGVLLTLTAFLLYLPFYLGFRSQTAPPFLLPMAMQPTRFVHFLTIFGMPLISIVFLLGTLVIWVIKQKDAAIPKRAGLWSIGIGIAVVGSLFLLMLLLGWAIAVSPEGQGRVMELTNELGLNLQALSTESDFLGRLIWAAKAITTLIPEFTSARLTQPALIVFLTSIFSVALYLMMRIFNTENTETTEKTWQERIGNALPFVLLLIMTATLLTIGPEFVYLRDNFGQRINTIFKFYYQAWVFWGVAAVFGLEYLLRKFRLSGLIATTLYIAALLVALLFPAYAVRSRSIEYRGPVDSPDRAKATLDGLAYLKDYNSAEYEALQWLRENIDGSPVILEAVGGQYSGYGRVSAITGLPTVLGWAGHEYQWRGNTPEPGIRQPAIETIYNQSSWPGTAALLDQFQVSLIYYGPLERTTYDPRGLDKFENNLEPLYKNENVTIFGWQTTVEP